MFTAPTAKNDDKEGGGQVKDIKEEETRQKVQTVWVGEATRRIHMQKTEEKKSRQDVPQEGERLT